MKKKVLILILVLTFLFPATLAMGKKEVTTYGQDDLFIPDMTEANFIEDAITEDAVSTVPGAVFPFWTDLVDTENVSEDGAGVYVAVLDTGLLDSAPFFFSEANIAYDLGVGFTHDVYWDDTVGDIVFGPLRDDRGYITGYGSGHGTHVTSTIVGFQYSGSSGSFWVSGVAPEVTIIPVLVLDGWVVDTPDGLVGLSGGTDEMVSAGIYYIADLAPTLDGPVVINMSLGGPDPSPMIEEAVNYAIEQGVIVVASAGNEGTAGMGYPGGYPQVISAGAAGWASMFNYGWRGDVPENLKSMDILGNTFQYYLEDFSSRPNKDLGQKNKDLDVSAPGAFVVGPYKSAFSSSIGYYYLSGTSMAAPHVSAISALVLQKNPVLNQEEVETVLRLAAAGNPLPASDAVVLYPFAEPYYYISYWDGGDAGKGFLQADQAIQFTP